MKPETISTLALVIVVVIMLSVIALFARGVLV
jgi:preprotein translocase subunit SecE